MGKVVDTQNKPINFFYAGLFNAIDTSLIKGESFENGCFSFEDLHPKDYILKISCLGYVEKHLSYGLKDSKGSNDLGIVVLNTTNYNIDEVQVHYSVPTLAMHNDKLIFNIKNTVFSNAGTGLDVLARTPYVFVGNNEISVAGRSSTLVLINGKRINNIEEVRILNSSQIEKIEIIENPSAKYEADGHAVVNIHTTKRITQGLSASNYTGYQRGKKGTTFSTTEVLYNKGNLSSYLSIGYQNVNREGIENTINKIITEDLYFISNTYHLNNITTSNNLNYRVGTEYNINKLHSISIQSDGYINSGNTSSITNMDITRNGYISPTQQSFTSDHLNPKRFSFNISYNGKFLSVVDMVFMADATTHNEDKNTQIMDVNLGNEYSSNIESFHSNTYNLYTTKLDLALPIINKMCKLEAGARFSYIDNNNSFEFRRNSEGVWLLDPNFSNVVIYSEKLFGLYSILSGDISKFHYSLGLRFEHLEFNNTLLNDSSFVNQESRKHLFPNITISYNHSKNISSRYTFSRRISRPSYSSLNNSMLYIDSLSVRKGNPFLEPTIYNTFSSNLSLYKKFNVGITYSFIEKPLDLIFINDNENIERRTVLFENTENTWSVGANVSSNLSYKMWRTQPFLSFSYQPVFLTEDDFRYVFKYPSYTIRWNNQLSVHKSTNLDINVLFRQPAGSFKKFGKVLDFDLGITKKLLNSKLSLSLLFNWKVFPWTQYHNYSYKYCYVVWDSNNRQSVSFSFRYNFTDKQPSFKKRTASEEEIRRM